MANPYEPDLGIRMPGAQLLCCFPRHLAEGVGTCQDVNGNDLAAVACFHKRPYLLLVDLVATPGNLFGRVSRLLSGHDLPSCVAHPHDTRPWGTLSLID